MSGPPTAWRARCPAKVNLDLRVLGPREDGHHELRTLFQAIDLEDELVVRDAPAWSLECDDPGVPNGEGNLVLRAAREVALALGRPGTAAFRLHKRIPVGGGLGGGSSDAAAAILLLERLWGRDLGPRERVRIAASVGADVPFFLVGGTALGTGRGDRIVPVAFEGEVPLVLGVPPFAASTAEVFREVRARLTPRGDDVSVPRLSGGGFDTRADGVAGRNDLETVAFDLWPVLGRFRDALLDEGAESALLSGSGSTVFGRYRSRSARVRAVRALRGRFPDWRVLTAEPVPHGVRVAPADGRR